MQKSTTISENIPACKRVYGNLGQVCENIVLGYQRIVGLAGGLRKEKDFEGSQAMSSFISSMQSRESVLHEVQKNLNMWDEEFYKKWQKALNDMYSTWE